MASSPNSSTRPRAHLTVDLVRRLKHLAVDLGVPVGDLLAEGVVLLLRWHSRAEGLPEPTPPSFESQGKEAP